MTSLDFEVAFVWVGVDSTRVINVSVNDGDVGEGLRRNIVQSPADLKPEGGVAGRGIVEYVRSVDLDDFHYLKKTGEISKRVRRECMLETHVLWGTFEESLPCEHCLTRHARDAVVPGKTVVQGVRGDIDRVLVRSHDDVGMDCGLEGVVLFLVVEGLGLVIWISKAVLMAVLDVLEREVWGSDVLEIIGAGMGSDAGATGENEGGGVNVHRRRCVWGGRAREKGEDEGRRRWWRKRERGVLNKRMVYHRRLAGVGDHV
jgi:hypothetical protein